MIILPKGVKQDPFRRWSLNDRTFFAAGACHILTYVYIKEFTNNYNPIWLKPKSGHTGNHIVATNGEVVFDYQGIQEYSIFFNNWNHQARLQYEGWECSLISLDLDVLVSEKKSKEFDGLWLREPGQFYENPIPRARKYIQNILEK